MISQHRIKSFCLLVSWVLLSLLGGRLPTTAAAQDCLPPPTGLIAWWSGDKSGSDITGRGFDAFLQGGSSAGAPGMVGGAFEFDGKDGIARSNLLLPSQGTISFWVKPEMLSFSNRMVGTFGTNEGNDRLWIAIWGPTGEVPNSLVVNLGIQTGDDIVIANPISEGVWSHLALTFDYDSDEYILYVNGKQAAICHAARTAPTQPFSFGGVDAHWWPYENYYSGLLDELGIYDRVLTSQEIEAIYQAASAGVCKNAQTTILPQVVYGAGWYTVVSLTNPTPAEPSEVSLRVYDYLGQKLYQEDLDLPAGRTRRVTFSGSPSHLITGYAVIEQSGAVVTSARYEGRDESGQIVESVGVIPREDLDLFDGFIVDVVCDEKKDTGIALVPTLVETIDSGRVIVVLFDDEGRRIDETELVIGKHYSGFTSEIFSGLEKPFSGHILVNHGGSSDKVQALGMLMEYRLKQFEFTSLPIHPWDDGQ